MESTPLRKRLIRPFVEFFDAEASGGIVLMIAALAALLLANSPWSADYFRVWQINLGMPLILWINDGLMAVFFFLVGLEIKREILVGELASARQAALPIFAALGGMVVPALIYVAVNAGQPSARGWGVPMATDIAFALGVLNLLGKRVPLALKVFLAAVAIVDDLGAVIVIALFYSGSMQWAYLAGAAAILAALFLLNRFGVRHWAAYILPGFVLWFFFLQSGVHATIAGVLLAMTIPARSPTIPSSEMPLERIEHALQKWVGYLIMPIFAFANAGVALSGQAGAALGSAPGLGTILGLILGKPLGVCAASYLAVKTGIAELPKGVVWRQMAGVGVLAGIGFTMSLFIAELAFKDETHLVAAKVAILVASLIAGTAGFLLLRRNAR